MAENKPSKRARRKPLSRERVIEAAVSLADSQGIENLSMRRLADTLGVEAMSLYNHVKGKEDLVDGMVERVAREFASPDPTAPWKDEMRRRGLAAYDMLCRHPWASLPLVSRVNAGPVMLAYVEATLGCLHGAGFTYQQADRLWNAMDSHIFGFTLQEQKFPFAPQDYASVAKDYLPSIPRDRLPNLYALTCEVADGQHFGTHDFSFGLDLILDATERLLSRN